MRIKQQQMLQPGMFFRMEFVLWHVNLISVQWEDFSYWLMLRINEFELQKATRLIKLIPEMHLESD